MHIKYRLKKSFQFFVLIAVLVFTLTVEAESYRIKSQAPTVSSPSATKALATLPAGRRVEVVEMRGEWARLKTKSGRPLWVNTKFIELNPQRSVQEDVVEQNEISEVPYDSAKRWSFDLGASSGSYQSSNYSEFNIGLNYFIKEWLAFRNAAFARFDSNKENIYGLDTSFRAIGRFLLSSSFGVTVFAGPGYRFVNRGTNVPFSEGGLLFKIGGFSLGAGAKMLMYPLVQSGAANDSQFFLIFAGGGSF